MALYAFPLDAFEFEMCDFATDELGAFEADAACDLDAAP